MNLAWLPHEQHLCDPCHLYSSEELMFGHLYSLLIQMNLPASICDKNGKTLLRFQMAALCGRLTVSEMTTNLQFFFHCLYLSLPFFICSPSVELISVSFFKTLASEGLCGRQKCSNWTQV